MAVVLAASFDHASTAGWTVGAAATHRYVNTVVGTPTLVQDGADWWLEISQAGVAEHVIWDANTIGASMNRLVASFRLRFPSALPSADVELLALGSPGADPTLRYRTTGTRLAVSLDGTNHTLGPTVVADTTYKIEIYSNMSANPHTFDWVVDGTQQTQATNAVAANTIDSVRLGGTIAAQTTTHRFRDVVVWTDTADLTFPVGAHKVVLLKPDTGGSLDVATITTSEWDTFAGATPTHTAWNATTALAAIDEIPVGLGASADGFCRITGTDADFVGVPMTSYTLQTGESIAGLRLLACCWAESATTNTHSFAAYNGTTAETVFAAADVGTDNSSTAPAWVCKMLPTLANYDTQGELDGLQVRVGSTDSTPDSGVHAVYVDVAVAEAAGTPITLNDTGAAADSLSVAAAVPLADAGTGVDSLTVDTGVTAVTLAEVGAGSDSLTVTAAVALADQGAAADSPTVTVAADLAEQGAAADSLDVQLPAGSLGGALLGTPPFQLADVQLGTILVAAGGTPKDLADVGAGADSLTVAVAAPLAEVGAAADTVTVAAQVTLNDSGVASDSIAAGIFKVLAEQGTAADTLTVTVAAPLAEQGSGTDAVSVSASVPLADTGVAADTVAAAVPAVLADAGTASDSLTVTVAAPLAEQGTAADTLGVAAQITLGTVGAAADTVSVGVAVAKTLSDQGAAADSLAIGAAVPLAEFAAAADAVAVQALLALAEQGAAADTVSVLDVAATPGTLTVASAPLALIATSDVGALLAAGTSRIGGPA